MRELLQQIALKHELELTRIKALSGGDINQVYLWSTNKGDCILKLNHSLKFPQMLQRESESLQHLAQTKSFKIPKVIACDEHRQFQYLILEHITAAQPAQQNWHKFGEQLASLHNCTQDQFGYTNQNYIGELPQYNFNETTAAQFYINQRILPQLNLAAKNNFSLKHTDAFLKQAETLIAPQEPSLIHGDLWSGNYLYNEQQGFCLIDPAIAFNLKNFDIAMMKLFGGFPQQAFEAYFEHQPEAKLESQHLTLYQLYYLLVHLNIFGQSYFAQCQNIISKYA